MKFIAEHFGLPALKPTALKDWYVNVLGATLVFDNGQTPPAYFITLAGGLMLEIYTADSSLKETAHNALAGWRHLALQVETIEAAQAELEKRGVKFHRAAQTRGRRRPGALLPRRRTTTCCTSSLRSGPKVRSFIR